MLKITIEDAQVLVLNETTLNLQSGERKKQEVLIAINTPRGVETYQVEVWDENIDKMALQPNEVVSLHAGIISRQKDGRWYNTLQAYRAERGAAQQATTTVQTDEDTF